MIGKTGSYRHGNGRVHVVSFVKAPLEHVRKAMDEWAPITGYSYILVDHPSESVLATAVTPPNRCALIPTDSSWTAYVDNDRIGNWPMSFLFSMAEVLKTTSCAQVFSIDDARPTARGFGLWDGTGEECKMRTVQNSLDKKWEFQATGDALSFEDVGKYQNREMASRLTNEDVLAYGHAIGVKTDDPSFFDAAEAIVFERKLS